MGARRKARELALQMLYQHDVSGNPPDMIIATFDDLQKSKPNTREFATRVFKGTVDHLPKIDEMIVAQADNWRIERRYIEALDQTVGLRVVGLGQAMVDAVLLAEPIKGMTAGRPTGRLVLLVDGEALGELGAIVGQDGVNIMREVGQEALEEAGRSLAVPPGVDLDIDVASGAIDGDKGITRATLQGRQMLEVDMDEPNTGGLEDAGLWVKF